MKRSLLIAAAFALTTFAACNKKTSSPSPETPGICGTVFTQTFIHVQTAAHAPVVLDSFVVTDAAGVPLPPYNGNNVWGSLQGSNGIQGNNGIMAGGCIVEVNGFNGAYAIINDAWAPEHQNTKTEIWAKGFIQGRAVFSESYIISTDCCKASKFAGKDLIILQ